MTTLFSFLGMGDYQETIYTCGNQEVKTRFVQIAVAKIFKVDKAVIFVTSRAKDKNAPGLKKEGQEHNVNLSLVDIPETRTEDQIWELFNILQKNISEKEQLIIDITHSFRSIPIVSLACIQYASVIKNAELKGIYYGSFESGEEKAPIVNITSFLELMDWSRAVANFVELGEIQSLSQLANKNTSGIQEKKAKNNLATFVHNFKKIQEHILTSRLNQLSQCDWFHQLKKNLANLRKHQEHLPAPFVHLMDLLEQKIKLFFAWEEYDIPEEIKRGFGVVSWCIEHDLIQQGYTLLQENLISYLCMQSGLDWKKKDPDRRLIPQIPKVIKLDKSEWQSPAKEYPQKVEYIHNNFENLLELLKQIGELRNNINHGFGEIKPEVFKNRLVNFVKKLEKILPKKI